MSKWMERVKKRREAREDEVRRAELEERRAKDELARKRQREEIARREYDAQIAKKREDKAAQDLDAVNFAERHRRMEEAQRIRQEQQQQDE